MQNKTLISGSLHHETNYKVTQLFFKHLTGNMFTSNIIIEDEKLETVQRSTHLGEAK